MLHLFEHHEAAVWERLSREIGAEFIHERGWRNDKVVYQAEDWTISLDLCSEAGYKAEYLFTRLMAVVPNAYGFHFTLDHKNLFDRVAHFFGTHDVHVGDAKLDATYEIRTNDEVLVKEVFAAPTLRALVKSEETLSLRLGPSLKNELAGVVSDDAELTLTVEGEVNDIERLRKLYRLFCGIMSQVSVLIRRL